MKNSKNTTVKSADNSDKKTVDVELNDDQLDAVSGGIIDGPGGGCTGPVFPWEPKEPNNGPIIFNQDIS